MIKLAVFDFDATLMDGETIDFLAREAGVEELVSAITKDAMEGGLDFFESINKRVSLLKGLDYKTVEEVCHNLPYMNGAKEIITELKKRDIKTILFSGGFRVATSYAQKKLGLDAEFANTLHVKNGKLSGKVSGEMMFSSSKGDMLTRLQDILNITKDETMSVGDGANDISMFEHSSIKVAFCAKEALKKHASLQINTKDLTQILNHI